MLDNLQNLVNTIRGNYSKNPETSVARGRNLVRANIGKILIIVGMAVGLGLLNLPDMWLLALYSSIPMFFDSSFLVEFIPLIGRILPRATIVFELGFEVAAFGLGISLTAIYAIYKFIGAFSMGLSWHMSRKEDE